MNHPVLKYVTCLAILLFSACSQFSLFAQGNVEKADSSSHPAIGFYPILKSGGGIKSEAAQQLLQSKLEQALARCEAGGNEKSPFLIQAYLEVGEIRQTEGLVQNISTVTGNLMLQAKDASTGDSYGGITIPLKATVKGLDKDLEKILVASLKTTDPKFVRLVRNARKAIEEKFSTNCASIIAEAKKLGAAGKCQEAVDYLMGIPSYAPCYEEALDYIAMYSQTQSFDEPTSIPDSGTEPRQAADDEFENGQESIHETPDEEEPSEKQPQVPGSEPSAGNVEQDFGDWMQIDVSNPDMQFKILSCHYDEANRTIVLTFNIQFDRGSRGPISVGLDQAVGADGEYFRRLFTDGGRFVNFPPKVWIKKTFYIENVSYNPETLSYLKFHFSHWKAEIRNLKLK